LPPIFRGRTSKRGGRLPRGPSQHSKRVSPGACRKTERFPPRQGDWLARLAQSTPPSSDRRSHAFRSLLSSPCLSSASVFPTPSRRQRRHDIGLFASRATRSGCFVGPLCGHEVREHTFRETARCKARARGPWLGARPGRKAVCQPEDRDAYTVVSTSPLTIRFVVGPLQHRPRRGFRVGHKEWQRYDGHFPGLNPD